MTLIPGDRITVVLDGKFTEMVVAGTNDTERRLYVQPVARKEDTHVTTSQR